MQLPASETLVAPYRRMPEPPRTGLGGHLTEWLGPANAKSVLARLLRYAEACGPVARVTLGPVRLVLVSDADVAAEVLDDPRANYKGASYILTRAVLDNVLLLNGSAWEEHRSQYKQALRDVDVLRSANLLSERFVAETKPGPMMLDAAIIQLVGDVAAHFTAGITLDPAL
ncbi:MAG: hypothetical protein HOV80_37805, partial [Polyangiaceae bacterium]|nr:hypothetical protein [Polyangiaceae bacterium]